MKLTISREFLDQIQVQAKRARPDEACGLMVGLIYPEGNGEDRADVTAIHASENFAAHKADSFEIDPVLHLGLQRDLRGSGKDILGVYHSHPSGPARPSARDEKAAAYPGWIWLIIGWEDGKPATRAFLHEAGRDADEAFGPVEIDVRG